MWDFIAAAWGWGRQKLGKNFNAAVAAIALLVVGYYANSFKSYLVSTKTQIDTVQQNQVSAAADCIVIHSQLDELRTTQKTMEVTQKTTAQDVRNVGRQLDTLQVVLVNKLNLILPTLGEYTVPVNTLATSK